MFQIQPFMDPVKPRLNPTDFIKLLVSENLGKSCHHRFITITVINTFLA